MRLTLLFFILISVKSQAQTGFVEKFYPDYALSIPETWTAISELFLDSLSDLHQETKRSYIIGFQDSSIANFPYIILKFVEIIQPDQGSNFDTIADIHIRKLRDLGIESEVTKDPKNTRFYLEFMNIDTRIFSGTIYGKNGFIDFSYYSKPIDKVKDFELFQQIFNSVKLNEPFINNTEIADKNEDMSESGKIFFIATILFIVVSVARWFIKKKNRE